MQNKELNASIHFIFRNVSQSLLEKKNGGGCCALFSLKMCQFPQREEKYKSELEGMVGTITPISYTVF